MKIPSATYRLQFQPEFGFADAAEIIPYLHQLGISHIYASPIFRARRGSLHGYDGVDPNTLNPELGTVADWEDFVSQMRTHGMGLLLDIVPNHMAYSSENRMLADVLENGPASGFSGFFDICWDHPSPDLQGRVMAPFLGQRYKTCLMNGEIRLAFDADGLAVTYGDLKFPLRLETYRLVLDRSGPALETEPGQDHPDYSRLLNTLEGLEALAQLADPELRSRGIEAVKLTLWQLSRANAAVRRHILECVERFNAEPGDHGGVRLLDRLLRRQHFRLCHWKNATAEINYRRFFDINGLISLRQDREPVFAHTHTLLARLAAGEIVTGVRIDHIDGLADPEGYLRGLRRTMGADAYILVEKILAAEEALPGSWPVQGTTGYDFAHRLNALFVRRGHEASFDRIYRGFSGCREAFEEVVCDAKKHLLSTRLAGDLDNLCRRIKDVSALVHFAGNLTLNGLRQALCEILAHFPIYRTYIGPQGAGAADRNIVQAVLSEAVGNRPDLKVELAFIGDLFLGGGTLEASAEKSDTPPAHLKAVQRFQQLSAALMAKGCEDTAFYRYHRLCSLNDVGFEPDRFGCSIERFHEFVARRAHSWPHAMNCTATHDSKRGEDVRARLNVLSEIPAEWEAHITAWHDLNRHQRIDTDSGPVPDRNTEYLLYQTLIGIWPTGAPVTERCAERVNAYMIKAAREAGEQTSWLDPQPEYENAVGEFVSRILDASPQNGFLQAFWPFCEKIAHYGLFNSLAQSLLKISVPGVPDFYQGTELPQLALVDPDNRQPVSYGVRRRLLELIGGIEADPIGNIKDLMGHRNDGRIKLFVVSRALETRRRLKDLFQTGRYLPLKTRGAHRRNIVAFARVSASAWCAAVVPRFLTDLVAPGRDPLGEAVWRDTEVILPPAAPGSWQNVFTREEFQTGATLSAGAVFRDFPVALLAGGQIP